MVIGLNNNIPSRKPDVIPVNKYGVNFDIDAGPETIWSHGGLFPFLDVGIPMDIVSTLAADDIAGIGAQKVQITHYLTDNTEVVTTHDLDGITPVQFSDDCKICTRIEVVQAGTGKTNAGKLSIVDRATGLVVYQSVEVGEGQTLSAIQICPKAKKGLVVKHRVSFAKTQSPAGSADLRLNLRKANGTVLTKHPVVISTTKDEDVESYPGGSGIEMEEGDIIYWECLTVSAANTPIIGRFDIEFFNA